ncbi:hypothetical protein RAA17_16680 [Komagataeibacter rhaeticus]|nr:hypothetical protein [Komagataeibacter rhaeticus]
MSEQIVNLFPEIYMRELDKSADEYDRKTSAELRKIWNGETTEYESQFADIDGLKRISRTRTVKSANTYALKMKTRRWIN